LGASILVAEATTVGSGVLVAEAVAKPGAVVTVGLLPVVLVGTGLPKICEGSPQLIRRMASTINTVKIFRFIPFLLSINDLLPQMTPGNTKFFCFLLPAGCRRHECGF
jgi:hypothetical protein